jgi:lipopolysaccharide transport system permease protein
MQMESLENPVIPQGETEIIIQPARGWLDFNIAGLWQYRELLYFLAWRDIKVRYKQTVLGVAWVILQPVLTMLIFSVIFGWLAGLPSEGVPYPLFTFAALVPWQLFSYSLTQSSTSLVADQNLITKVFFPRLIIPTASVLAGVLDFAISLLILFGMMIVYGIPFSLRLLVLPCLILLTLMTALAVGLWLSALNVQYRDVRYTLSFLTLFWMYATPIAYSSTLIPERWRLLYSLNPMVGVVEGFRWALFDTDMWVGPMVFVSAGVMLVLLIGGLIYFRRMEDGFADVI